MVSALERKKTLSFLVFLMRIFSWLLQPFVSDGREAIMEEDICFRQGRAEKKERGKSKVKEKVFLKLAFSEIACKTRES